MESRNLLTSLAALESELHHKLNHPSFILSVDDFPKDKRRKDIAGACKKRVVEEIGKLSSNFQGLFINQWKALRQLQIGIAQAVRSKHTKSQVAPSSRWDVGVEEFRVKYGCGRVRIVDRFSQDARVGDIGSIASFPVHISKAATVGTGEDGKPRARPKGRGSGNFPTSKKYSRKTPTRRFIRERVGVVDGESVPHVKRTRSLCVRLKIDVVLTADNASWFIQSSGKVKATGQIFAEDVIEIKRKTLREALCQSNFQRVIVSSSTINDGPDERSRFVSEVLPGLHRRDFSRH